MSNVIPFPVGRVRYRTIENGIIDLSDFGYQLDFWEEGLEQWYAEFTYYECVLGVPFEEIPECN